MAFNPFFDILYLFILCQERKDRLIIGVKQIKNWWENKDKKKEVMKVKVKFCFSLESIRADEQKNREARS